MNIRLIKWKLQKNIIDAEFVFEQQILNLGTGNKALWMRPATSTTVRTQQKQNIFFNTYTYNYITYNKTNLWIHNHTNT